MQNKTEGYETSPDFNIWRYGRRYNVHSVGRTGEALIVDLRHWLTAPNELKTEITHKHPKSYVTIEGRLVPLKTVLTTEKDLY